MWKLAWRNVLRNKRRTLLSVAIIALGTGILFVVQGYIAYSYWGLQYSAISQYGHLQIAMRGSWQQGAEPLAHLMPAPSLAQLEEFLTQEPAVLAFTRTLEFSGIIGTAKQSTIFVAQGVEPESEVGEPLITQGTRLLEGDHDKVLLGEGVAQKLGVQLGEYVSLLTMTPQGVYNASSAQISGFFTVGQKEADKHLIFLPLSFSQQVLNTSGVERVIVLLKEGAQIREVAQRLQAGFAARGWDLEVRRWDELATLYHQVRALYEAAFTFMSTAIFVLVFFSTLESISMAFFERVRELGILRAIGASRALLFQLFIKEGAILGGLGGLVGIALGWSIGGGINAAELSYIPPTLSMAVPLKVQLSWTQGYPPLLITAGSAVLAAFYPAFKACRLQVVEAIRYA